MRKSVITINRPSSQEKSATISEVANQLMAAFPNHTIQVINTRADIAYIIEINGVKTRLESQRDPKQNISEPSNICSSRIQHYYLFLPYQRSNSRCGRRSSSIRKSFSQLTTAHGIEAKQNSIK